MEFEFSFPTRIVFGLGKFQSTAKEVKGMGKRAFIATSRSFGNGARKPMLDDLVAQLGRNGVEVMVFSEIEPNPRTTTIDRAATMLREFNPRYIIALGGGSVMDAAKCLAILAVNPGKIYDYVYKGPGKPMTSFNHTLPLVCAPTVAATSSETSIYAVVTDWELHRKVAVFGDSLQPTLSIIDPELTYTISPRQTIDGAFDMITHVIESYLSTPDERPIQDRFSEGIIETVVQSLPKVLENPKDGHARSQLSWCGALALSGILDGRNGGWPIHAFEHGLSAWTDAAHGRGLSMLLPPIMKFDQSKIEAKLKHFNRRIFGADTLEDGFFKYMKQVDAWTTLGQVSNGMTSKDLVEKIVDHAFEVQGIYKTGQEPYLDNIKPIYRNDALEIVQNCI